MNKVYLISTAGYPNYGDEQIVRTWLKFFSKNRSNVELTLDVPFPARAQFLFGDDFTNVKFVDTVWNAIYKADHDGADLEHPEAVIAALSGGDPRNQAGIDYLLGSDSIHLLGGGYFDVTSETFKKTYLFFPLLKFVKEQNPKIKLLATGLGLTPITPEYQASLAQKYIPLFDYFGVRDARSAEITGATLELDDVFMAKKLDAIQLDENPAHPDILLAIQPFVDDEHRDAFLNELIAYLQTEENAKKRIGVLEAMIEQDNWLFFSDYFDQYPEIKARMTFFGFWDLWQKGLPYKEDQVWISTRYHFHVIGSLLGVKGTAVLVGGDYYENKHHSLNELGTGWQILDPLDENITIQPGINSWKLMGIRQNAKTKIRMAKNDLYPKK